MGSEQSGLQVEWQGQDFERTSYVMAHGPWPMGLLSPHLLLSFYRSSEVQRLPGFPFPQRSPHGYGVWKPPLSRAAWLMNSGTPLLNQSV